MENLTISDPQGPASPGLTQQMTMGRAPPPQQQQLPPQMFTTAAQLLDLTDKKLLIVLRDGRKLMGILRSWDQFANLVLQSTVERIFVPPASSPDPSGDGSDNAGASRGLYADIPHGIFLVRGENVLLLGEIDLDKDDDPPPGYDKGEVDEVKRLAKERKTELKNKEKDRTKKLAMLGFEGENLGEILF